MNFTDTPVCTSRTNCFQCRNNKGFRAQMEQQWGSWECPEGFAIGTPLEGLPEKTQESQKKIQGFQEERQRKIGEAIVALDELEALVSGEGKRATSIIRSFVAPNTKTAATCEFGGEEVGEVDQECCGGKISKVKAYDCSKQTTTATDRKCASCSDFRKVW